MSNTAAGIFFLARDNTALFVRRGATAPDFPGYWCFPGGHAEEDDKDAEATAIREGEEETGFRAKRGDLKLLTRTNNIVPPGPEPTSAAMPAGDGPAALPPDTSPADAAPVDFSTFLLRVVSQFTPKLCDESDSYCWASVDNPPTPLHPGCAIALARLGMDELGVAEAMSRGELTSPQRYENVTLWNIRITGTGAAYRSSLGEFVWRDPSIYMNDRFLRRCNGLSVIMKHPKGATLTSEEFGDRIVGSVFVPYLKPEVDEVWAIVKVYDDWANASMDGMDLSTSPAVVFKEMGPEHRKIKLDDGAALLIEGDPKLLDHIAICEAGVWDKGGEPTGVINDSVKETVMADEAEMKKEERDDEAGGGVTLDKVLKAVDAISKRMDSMESARKDSRRRADAEGEEEEKREDGEEEEIEAREDGEDEGEEPGDPKRVVADKKKDSKRKDTKKADGEGDEDEYDDAEGEKEEEAERHADAVRQLVADNRHLRTRLRDIELTMPKVLNDADYHALAATQAEAAPIFQAFGDTEPRPLNGEDDIGYRRRLTTLLKKHSPKWKDINVVAIADDAAFETIRKEVYADALATAHTPQAVPVGMLQEIVNVDETGRRIKTFAGEPRAWMGDFMGGRKLVSNWKTETRH